MSVESDYFRMRLPLKLQQLYDSAPQEVKEVFRSFVTDVQNVIIPPDTEAELQKLMNLPGGEVDSIIKKGKFTFHAQSTNFEVEAGVKSEKNQDLIHLYSFGKYNLWLARSDDSIDFWMSILNDKLGKQTLWQKLEEHDAKAMWTAFSVQNLYRNNIVLANYNYIYKELLPENWKQLRVNLNRDARRSMAKLSLKIKNEWNGENGDEV